MKKKVSILLATYRPNLTFLVKQLESIENQTYKNLELIILDDSACENHFIEIERKIIEVLKTIPFTLLKNEQNLGSNKSFEKLTRIANGDYFAYCDQDDIWEKDKVKLLVQKIENENSVICYSDLSIINSEDVKVADSFKDISKRLNHVYGEKVYDYFIRRNSITGCTMLIDGKVAKNSLPFPDYKLYVHDHWLALNAALVGKVSYISMPLVKYRIHENNQIGNKVLDGINNKKDYFDKKLLFEKNKINLVQKRRLEEVNPLINETIIKYDNFISSRINFYKKKSLINFLRLIKNSRYDLQLTLFELLIFVGPSSFVDGLLKKVKS